MNTDLFDELATGEVPPLPVDFDRSVHQRLNRVLVFSQAAEVVFQVLPYALAHFGQALMGLAAFTLSGRNPAADSSDHV